MIKEIYLNQKLGEYSQVVIAGQIEDNSEEKLIETSRMTSYFVAEQDACVIGIGGYDQHKVRTMFVRNEYQRKGVGKMLLERILSEAKRAGIRELRCWSTPFAEAFYSKFGFTVLGDLELPYRGETLRFKEMLIRL